MTKLTITEAVKRSGVSRTTFTNRYLKTGLVTPFEINGKQHVKTADLTKAMTLVKKTAKPKSVAKPKLTVKAKAKSAAKPKAAVKTRVTLTRAKPATKAQPKTTTKTKTATTLRSKPASIAAKLTDVEMLKLRIKKLRAELKSSLGDKELLQKENDSLSRKNVSLSRRLTTSPVNKPKPRAVAKPASIRLTLPESDKKTKKSLRAALQKLLKKNGYLRQKEKTRATQKQVTSDNEHWVDKWWDNV